MHLILNLRGNPIAISLDFLGSSAECPWIFCVISTYIYMRLRDNRTWIHGEGAATNKQTNGDDTSSFSLAEEIYAKQ